jgi:hypothetical protein
MHQLYYLNFLITGSFGGKDIMKCISCGAELPPQSRFCGACGTVQPGETNAGDSNSIETIRSKPHADNIPADVPPPPPQPQQNIGEIQKRTGEVSPPAQEENKPQTNSSTGQFSNPPSGPHPQTFYDDRQQSQQSQQLQQPHSSYQPQPYGDYQSPPPPYGNYQQPPQLYGNYQQPPSPYGNYQTPPQPSGNYQQSPLAQPPYINFPPTQHFGEYQTPPQPSGISQQLPQPQPSGIHTTDTAANINTGVTGGMKPTTPETRPKVPAWGKWAIIGVVAVVILAGSGILVYFLTKPTPTIKVVSKYSDKGIPAGATGTTLQVTGEQFAANSAITFLLDSTPVNTQTVSDPSGNVSTDLKVTSDWSVGSHKLTAHDASNSTTKTGTAIAIVEQGEDSTPGPNGAPSNDATFNINVDTQEQWDDNSRFTDNFVLKVTGQHNPQVCDERDNDTPQSGSVTFNGTTYPDQSTYTCSGTYKGGMITYNETLQALNIFDSKGNTCSLSSPVQSYKTMKGRYTDQQFSGTITQTRLYATQFTCSLPFDIEGATGNWTGNNS